MQRFIFLLLLCLHTPQSAISSVTGDVYKLATDFNNLASPTIDWLEHMRFIVTNSTHFLKLAGPVSALIASGLDIAFAPESPELQALRQLKEAVTTGFSNIEQKLQSIEGRILNRLNMVHYSNQISMNIVTLRAIVKHVTNTNFNYRKRHKNSFIRACVDDHNIRPSEILERLKEITVTNCPMPTKSKEILHSKAIKTFWTIEHYFGTIDKFTEGYKEYMEAKHPFLYGQFRKNRRSAERDLNDLIFNIENLLNQNRSVHLFEFAYAINKFNSETENCILLTSLVSNDDKASAARFIASAIASDITKIMELGGICANTSFNGDKQEMDIYTKDIQDLSTVILVYIRKWFTKKLDLQWPTTQLAYAFETIKEEYVLPTNYNLTAHTIGGELLKRGLPNYHYHVLISHNWDEARYFGPNCFDDNCNGTFNLNGINIGVFRQKIESVEMAKKAKSWIDVWRKNITEIIGRQKESSLRTIIQIIDGEIGGLLQEDAYKGYIFLHNKEWREVKCVIEFGIFSQPALTEPAYTIVEYFINPSVQDAQRFNLFLFL